MSETVPHLYVVYEFCDSYADVFGFKDLTPWMLVESFWRWWSAWDSLNSTFRGETGAPSLQPIWLKWSLSKDVI